MSFSESYILELIRSIQAKPAIWDMKSEDYENVEVNDKMWEIVVIEVGKSMETDGITVLDAQWTWCNLRNTYKTCLATGNTSNFKFFKEMSFVETIWAWYNLPVSSYLWSDVNTKENRLLTWHFGFNGIMLMIFLYFFFFVHFGELICIPSTMPIFIWAAPVVLMLIQAMFYIFSILTIKYHASSHNISLIWPSVLICGLIPIIKKVTIETFTTTSTVQFYSAEIFFLFFMGSFMNTYVVIIFFSSIKRPFPPSRLYAMVPFVYSMCWAYIIALINNMLDLHWSFRVIPIWVIVNAVLSALFHHYEWKNVDLLFPKFNQNPFEIAPRLDIPYHIEFIQKPRNSTAVTEDN